MAVTFDQSTVDPPCGAEVVILPTGRSACYGLPASILRFRVSILWVAGPVTYHRAGLGAQLTLRRAGCQVPALGFHWSSGPVVSGRRFRACTSTTRPPSNPLTLPCSALRHRRSSSYSISSWASPTILISSAMPQEGRSRRRARALMSAAFTPRAIQQRGESRTSERISDSSCSRISASMTYLRYRRLRLNSNY